uniref:Uncharacterized protein n=1 Tax=Meloidogyne javanica TaxID=6303 RepID=A0A915MSA5_MELJA
MAFLFILLLFVASFPIKLAEGMEHGFMQSGQKRPLIEPPDNRTVFLYTTDDELFGEPGNVTQVKTVYEILEQIGNGKLEEFGLQNDQNFGQITPKLINVINHFENNFNEHQEAINVRINQLIENYNNAINAGDQAMVNKIREEKINFILGRLNDFTELKTDENYEAFLVEYGLRRDDVNKDHFMGLREQISIMEYIESLDTFEIHANSKFNIIKKLLIYKNVEVIFDNHTESDDQNKILTPDEFAIIEPYRILLFTNLYNLYFLYYFSNIQQNLKSKIEEHYINPQLIAANFIYNPTITDLIKSADGEISIPSITRFVIFLYECLDLLVYIPGRPEIGGSSQQAGEGSQQAGEGTTQPAGEGSSLPAGEGTSQQAPESSSAGASRQEIEIYSKSFFDDYSNNSIRRSTQIVSERTIYGSHFYDKLPIPKLSEIDRKNVSDKLFRAFLNEWNKIREMLIKGRVEVIHPEELSETAKAADKEMETELSQHLPQKLFLNFNSTFADIFVKNNFFDIFYKDDEIIEGIIESINNLLLYLDKNLEDNINSINQEFNKNKEMLVNKRKRKEKIRKDLINQINLFYTRMILLKLILEAKLALNNSEWEELEKVNK